MCRFKGGDGLLALDGRKRVEELLKAVALGIGVTTIWRKAVRLGLPLAGAIGDRKSTRLNSSH